MIKEIQSEKFTIKKRNVSTVAIHINGYSDSTHDLVLSLSEIDKLVYDLNKSKELFMASNV